MPARSRSDTALRDVACPLLLVFGERDALVPVEASRRSFLRELAGNHDVTVRVFPGADHGLGVQQVVRRDPITSLPDASS